MDADTKNAIAAYNSVANLVAEIFCSRHGFGPPPGMALSQDAMCRNKFTAGAGRVRLFDPVRDLVFEMGGRLVFLSEALIDMVFEADPSEWFEYRSYYEKANEVHSTPCAYSEWLRDKRIPCDEASRRVKEAEMAVLDAKQSLREAERVKWEYELQKMASDIKEARKETEYPQQKEGTVAQPPRCRAAGLLAP